jgi:amidohydrolase
MKGPTSLSRFGIRREVLELFPEMVEIRRRIHRRPELGMREVETAELVASQLEKAGLEVRRGVGGTGVVGLLQVPSPRREGALLLRADMDALPIQEENPHLDFASEVPGVMHACGHDGHTAILLAAARVAAARREQLPGHVKFVFQPAEEGPGGALPMIRDGVLEDPPVSAAVALHLDSDQPVGSVGVKAGPMMAAADEFCMKVVGKGGHGAYPHQAVDAIVAASHLVVALQTLVSRNTDPNAAAVVSIGTFKAGHNFNIIAEEAELTGTLRTFEPAIRDHLKTRLHDLSQSITSAMGARCEFQFKDGYPPVVNDERMTAMLVEVASELLGKDHVTTDLVSMGGEDMAYFLQEVPGVFFFLGAGNPDKGIVHPHHSPHFDFDEEAMPLGVELLLRMVERYLETAS